MITSLLLAAIGSLTLGALAVLLASLVVRASVASSVLLGIAASSFGTVSSSALLTAAEVAAASTTEATTTTTARGVTTLGLLLISLLLVLGLLARHIKYAQRYKYY
jgi:hypothetical protein